MTDDGGTEMLEVSDIAVVLDAMATLLENFHQNDVALQNALSTLASRARSSAHMVDLQHVDLLTQIHSDLANLLPHLAACLSGRPTRRGHLKQALRLRSLQDSLVDPESAGGGGDEAGELSLF